MALNLQAAGVEAGLGLACDSDPEMLLGEDRRPRDSFVLTRLVRVAALASALLLAAVLVMTVPRPARRSPAMAEAGALNTGINNKMELDQWLYDGKWDTAPAAGPTYRPPGAPGVPGATVPGASVPAPGSGMGPAMPIALAMPEDMYDGNVCGDDEEYYGNLCYKKCSLLTNGEFTIRTSSFSCCQNHPCGIKNQKISVDNPCDGFDVAGNLNGQEGACPHLAGTCLEDEELLLGMCYKKCEILTNKQYPNRVAAATCCKVTGFACMNPMNLHTDFVHFAVGGGLGDKDPRTPREPHPPLTMLTEATPSKTP